MPEYKRWYDNEPTVSLLISLIKNAEADVQNKISNFIIKKAQEAGTELESDMFREFKRRWYDYDETTYNSIEYLRCSTIETRKDISIDAINYLYSISECIKEL